MTPPPVAPDPPGPQPGDGPRDVAHRLVQAYNDGDADRFAGLFTAHAEFINIFGTRMRGRGTIAAAHRAAFRTRLAGTELRVDDLDVAVVQDLTVVLHLVWTLRHTAAATPSSLERCTGVLTLVAATDATGTGWNLVAAANVRCTPTPR